MSERPSPAPHEPRPIRFIDLWKQGHWTIKVYGIRQEHGSPSNEMIEAAKRIALRTLPSPAFAPERYGAGFLTIHQAALFNSILVQWWERDNELRTRVFRSTSDELDFEEITSSGELACVWELRIMSFEREAWLGSVAVEATAVDWDGYFGAQLNEDS